MAKIWAAAGCPWSVRLKAMIPLWLPWAGKHIKELTSAIELLLLAISPRQMGRRLRRRKQVLGRRLQQHTHSTKQ